MGKVFAMSKAVQEILDRIQHLPTEDRLLLEDQLAQLAESEWRREAAEARRLARQRGIDQAAIDRAVETAPSDTGLCQEGNVLVHRGTCTAPMDLLAEFREERSMQLMEGVRQ